MALLPLGRSREVRESHLTPEGVRYASDTDRAQVVGSLRERALRQALREPLRMDLAELPQLVDRLGGRAARPVQPIVLYTPQGDRVIHLRTGGRHEMAELLEAAQRAAEAPRLGALSRPRTAPPKPGPAGQLLIAERVR